MKNVTRTVLSLLVMSAVLILCVSADDIYSSKDDPLVSLSYVNDILGPEIMTSVLDKIEADYVKKTDLEPSGSSGYVLLTLEAGKTVMARDICELVVVEGDASAVVTSAANIASGAGLIDTTSGSVIAKDENVPVNHSVIIPKADGRGIMAATPVRVLIRGEYNIAG